MKKVFVLGAGQSASTLIDFLLKHAEENNWHITVGDLDENLAKNKIDNRPNGTAMAFDIFNKAHQNKLTDGFDLVISMMPASFHIYVAKICAENGINMLTASYLSDDIKALNDTFVKNDAGLIMEMGLDPGIDHMSAMSVLDRIRDAGHELKVFETFTGGLLAPSDADNPWEYKFTWNPRNVVLAGQGYVKFIQENRFKYIPYQKLFRRTEIINIPGYGNFEGYANRDSLKYLDAYKLQGIKTLYRGTLRRVGYCKAWNVFVQLGATDDTYQLHDVANMPHRDFINSFMSFNPHDSVELKLAHYLSLEMEGEEMYKLKWLNIFSDEKVGLTEGTPAQILEHILKKKWTIEPNEKDMIVMWHKFEYMEGDELKQIQSYMAIEGEDSVNTAMSKTVGLPLAVSAELILKGEMAPKGVHIPTEKNIYKPVLTALEQYGVTFTESEL